MRLEKVKEINVCSNLNSHENLVEQNPKPNGEKERIFEHATIERIIERPFTTEPKTRRHAAFTSGYRLADYMFHLWSKQLKDCCYEVLKLEWIQWSGSNEPRTILRYLGRPEEIIRSKGSANILRQNINSGKIASFNYFNTRRVPAINGLIEILGYATRYKKGKETRFKLHYESFSWATIQENLPKYSTESEGVEGSIDNVCVCSVCGVEGKVSEVSIEAEEIGKNEREEREL